MMMMMKVTKGVGLIIVYHALLDTMHFKRASSWSRGLIHWASVDGGPHSIHWPSSQTKCDLTVEVHVHSSHRLIGEDEHHDYSEPIPRMTDGLSDWSKQNGLYTESLTSDAIILAPFWHRHSPFQRQIIPSSWSQSISSSPPMQSVFLSQISWVWNGLQNKAKRTQPVENILTMRTKTSDQSGWHY